MQPVPIAGGVFAPALPIETSHRLIGISQRFQERILVVGMHAFEDGCRAIGQCFKLIGREAHIIDADAVDVGRPIAAIRGSDEFEDGGRDVLRHLIEPFLAFPQRLLGLFSGCDVNQGDQYRRFILPGNRMGKHLHPNIFPILPDAPKFVLGGRIFAAQPSLPKGQQSLVLLRSDSVVYLRANNVLRAGVSENVGHGLIGKHRHAVFDHVYALYRTFNQAAKLGFAGFQFGAVASPFHGVSDGSFQQISPRINVAPFGKREFAHHGLVQIVGCAGVHGSLIDLPISPGRQHDEGPRMTAGRGFAYQFQSVSVSELVIDHVYIVPPRRYHFPGQFKCVDMIQVVLLALDFAEDRFEGDGKIVLILDEQNADRSTGHFIRRIGGHFRIET